MINHMEMKVRTTIKWPKSTTPTHLVLTIIWSRKNGCSLLLKTRTIKLLENGLVVPYKAKQFLPRDMAIISLEIKTNALGTYV